MKPSLQLTTKQTLNLSPRLQQAVKLLQLSAYELDLEIKAALDSNPLLEVDEEAPDDTQVDIIWDQIESSQQKNDSSHEHLISISAEPALRDYLSWQLNLTQFTDRERVIAMTLIDSINDDGYLCTTLNDISRSLQDNYHEEFHALDLSEIATVLQRIQQFDPPGVAARDLSECLLIQLKSAQIDNKLMKNCEILITKHLELLAKKDFISIKKLISCNDQELEAVLACIQGLNPKPGSLIGQANTEYIVPDVIAQLINNRWSVALNKELHVNLRVNHNYIESDNPYIRKQYNEAQWLLNSIKIRNITLLKVAGYIVQYQHKFFEYGESMMRPLILQVVANDLNLSESTISRITTKKYIYTPRGIFELKYFFSNNITRSPNKDYSAIAIKAIIKELISEENSKSPLSDQEITEIISARGIVLARRTVTKYREALGLRSSNQRGV